MRTATRLILFVAGLLLGTGALAGEVVSRLEVGDTVYENVRWGPVNDGKVTVFHRRGVATIPVANLPAAYQDQFANRSGAGMDGDSAWARAQRARADAQRVAQEAELEKYRADGERVAFYNGQVVEKAQLTELVGLVRGKATIEEDGVVTPGTMIELARPKENIDRIPPAMRLRPGLWQGTGTQVFLRDYQPKEEIGRPIRVWGEGAGEIKGHRTYFVARELSFEQWQRWRVEPPPADH